MDFILNTHHHWDHVGGNEELKQRYAAQIVGPKADEERIPGIDLALAEGETWKLGNLEMRVFDTPGHTRGHITLWFPEAEVMFPGVQRQQLMSWRSNCKSSCWSQEALQAFC